MASMVAIVYVEAKATEECAENAGRAGTCPRGAAMRSFVRTINAGRGAAKAAVSAGAQVRR